MSIRPSNTVSALVFDEAGSLWISTTNGLSRYTPHTGTFRNYNAATGLRNSSFFVSAGFKSKSGELFFGGNSGLIAFSPDDLVESTFTPPLRLTSIYVDERPVTLEKPLFEVDELLLSYQDRFIAFEFAALDYTAPEQNQFAYRLEGIQDDWVSLGTRHDLSFTSLDPGEYVLHLRGGNSMGMWNEDGIALTIRVSSPFWTRWWFLGLALAALFSLLVASYQVRTRTIRTRNQALQAEITERRRAEETAKNSEERLRLALEAALMGTWIWNIRTNEIAWSEHVERIFGLPTGAFAGTFEAYRNLIHPDDLTLVEQTIADAVARGQYYKVEHRIYWPDGSIHWLEGKGHVYLDAAGEPVRMTGTVQDITARKQAEREREALIADLEHRNAEMERFTYTVSHDLKSPLVTIKGFLGLLEQDAVRGDAERMKHDITQIDHAADVMGRLLSDLLELSRLGRVVNPSETVSLTELARQAVALLATQLDAGGVAVEIAPELPEVSGDRVRLLEVFQNLMENAIKFMGDQATPRVEIGARQADDEVTCYVRDNGMGIDPAYHEKVFGLFDRLDQGEGTGIGLALVKRIVEVHGGKIWVESEGEGHGSTFYFTLSRGPHA